MTVRVSPRAAMLFFRAGQPDRAIKFSAQLLDSAGAPVVPPPPGMRWEVSEQGGLRLGETGASSDGLSATANVHPGRPGRDTLFARSGGHSGHAVATNWDWANGSWSGPNWTVPGQSGCLELVGHDSGGNAVRLPTFDHTDWRSFDPEVLSADSLVVASDSLSARLCVTGHSVGRARVAVSAWDTTTLKYVGEYARFHVLKPPLTVAMEASEWELGVGQSHPMRLILTDDLGTGVPIKPEWADSWEVSDETVLAMDGGVVTGRASGSTALRATYLDRDLVANVEVYAITDVRFSNDVMCVITDRGAVRCWGDRWRPLWGYGRRTRGRVAPREVGDMPIGGLAAQFRWGSGSECVRTLAGDVRCWGTATGGLLGYGNLDGIGDDETPADAGPVPIGIGGRVVDIGGGDDFVCAVFDSGRVRCWGSNHAGQLGMGHQRQINVGDDETPADMDSDVLLGGKAVQVAGGRYKACALLDTGKVRCWGINAEDWDWRNKVVIGQSFGLGYGELGTIEPIGDDEPPSEAGDLELPGRATKIAVGGYHMCALMDDGAVRCWGDAGNGNLGHVNKWWEHIGDDETAAATVPLYFESPVVDLAAGYWHTCVLLRNGSVRCWGDGNTAGQLGIPGVIRLGDDEPITSVPPVRVGGPVGRIVLFEDGTCAVMRAGGLRCWGYNGGILGYPFRENIGDDEHPESVGDIKLFPGPVTRGRTGAVAADVADPADAVTPSVVVLPMVARGTRSGGPLAGPDGVIWPDSVGRPFQ
ncbi:RCC1 domain-containing protein [Candidatus Palauibacter sp.]|uniref:RCC1 domain-containing protein n=1 Tax=Candidatus Palauibacter sp. TaxID=3101350 RepID=UPI003B5CE3F4